MRNQQHGTNLVIVALLAYAAFATADDRSLRKELEQSRPYLSFLESKVNVEQCHRNEDAFVSCVAALEGMLNYDRRKLRLIHSSWRKSAKTNQVYKQFGAVQVVKDHMQSANDFSELSKQVSEKQQRTLAWREFYQERSGEKIDFDAIRSWVLAYIVDLNKATEYMAAAVNSFISTKDAHARIVPAKQLHQKRGEGNGRYFGIGISVNKLDDSVLVGRVLEDAPAFEAGLKTNDVILSIDGKPVDGKGLEEVVNALRGPAGTAVDLKINRTGQELYFSVERGSVIIRNVYYRVVPHGTFNWGLVKIVDFAQSNVCQESRKALVELKAERVDGLILDIRNNMGGLIDQAVCVAELFLEPNQVVLTMKKLNNNEQDVVVRTQFAMFTDLPMVTLINAASASASEVLAGALQDTARSFLIGERTFGKGSIQIAEHFASLGPVLKFQTVAKYYLPSGRTVDMLGLEPDLQVSVHPQSPDSQRIVLREADLFPKTQQSAVIGLKWEQPRPEAVATLNKCASDHGLPSQQPAQMIEFERADYLFEYAKQTLSCMDIHQIY